MYIKKYNTFNFYMLRKIFIGARVVVAVFTAVYGREIRYDTAIITP